MRLLPPPPLQAPLLALLLASGLAGCAAEPPPLPRVATQPLAGAAPASVAELPAPGIGDRIVLRNQADQEREDLVTVIGDESISLSYASGCTREYRRLDLSPPLRWSGCGAEPDAEQEVIPEGSLFPLAIGRTAAWSITGRNVAGERWSHRRTCRVAAAEQVTTPLGAEAAFRIDCEDPWIRTKRWVVPGRPLPVATEVEDLRRPGAGFDVISLYEPGGF